MPGPGIEPPTSGMPSGRANHYNTAHLNSFGFRPYSGNDPDATGCCSRRDVGSFAYVDATLAVLQTLVKQVNLLYIFSICIALHSLQLT